MAKKAAFFLFSFVCFFVDLIYETLFCKPVKCLESKNRNLVQRAAGFYSQRIIKKSDVFREWWPKDSSDLSEYILRRNDRMSSLTWGQDTEAAYQFATKEYKPMEKKGGVAPPAQIEDASKKSVDVLICHCAKNLESPYTKFITVDMTDVIPSCFFESATKLLLLFNMEFIMRVYTLMEHKGTNVLLLEHRQHSSTERTFIACHNSGNYIMEFHEYSVPCHETLPPDLTNKGLSIPVGSLSTARFYFPEDENLIRMRLESLTRGYDEDKQDDWYQFVHEYTAAEGEELVLREAYLYTLGEHPFSTPSRWEGRRSIARKKPSEAVEKNEDTRYPLEDDRYQNAPREEDDWSENAPQEEDDRYQNAPQEEDDRHQNAPQEEDDRHQNAPQEEDGWYYNMQRVSKEVADYLRRFKRPRPSPTERVKETAVEEPSLRQ